MTKIVNASRYLRAISCKMICGKVHPFDSWSTGWSFRSPLVFSAEWCFSSHLRCTHPRSRFSSLAIDAQLPLYNPVTRCHDLPVPDDSLSFALCLQRGSDKQHPYNLHTAPSFCSSTYSPHGHLIEPSELSSDLIDFLLQSLTKLLSTKTARIDRPEPNFLWISASKSTLARSCVERRACLDWTENSFKKEFWCPQPCRSKNNTEKNLILKTRCQYDNQSQPCLTTRHTHWDRAPFICLFNQTTAPEKKSVLPTPAPPVTPPPIVPVYSSETLSLTLSSFWTHRTDPLDDTIIFHDANSCLVARSRTHQYTFCFRRQACSLSQSSAFCTTRSLAEDACEREKNHSQLLTIENDDEYRLINEMVSLYSNETLLNMHGRLANKYIVRAQWMWIGGIRSKSIECWYGCAREEDSFRHQWYVSVEYR